MSDRTYTDEEIAAALNGEPIEEEAPVAEEEATPAEEVVEDDAPAEDEPEADEEPEVEPEAEVEDDWQLKYQKLQSAKDKEIAQALREAQELREQLAEKRGREAALAEQRESQQTSQMQAVTTEDLQHGIQNNLAATFQWTVENRPDLVPSLVSMVRETEGLGHPTADQMVVEYTHYREQLLKAEQKEAIEAIRAEREADQAPLRSREAMEDVVGSLTERFGENFEAVKDEIAHRMDTQGREYVAYLMQEAEKNGDDPSDVVTPQLLKSMMEDIYLELREEAMNNATAAPQQPQSVPAGAAAIGGNAATPASDDDSEEFLASFISGAKSADISVDPNFLP